MQAETSQLRPLQFRPRSVSLNAILSDSEGTLVLLITLKEVHYVLKLASSSLWGLKFVG